LLEEKQHERVRAKSTTNKANPKRKPRPFVCQQPTSWTITRDTTDRPLIDLVPNDVDPDRVKDAVE
jgi:type II secretory pathway component PulK